MGGINRFAGGIPAEIPIIGETQIPRDDIIKCRVGRALVCPKCKKGLWKKEELFVIEGLVPAETSKRLELAREHQFMAPRYSLAEVVLKCGGCGKVMKAAAALQQLYPGRNNGGS